MELAARNLEFERAAKLRDRIVTLKQVGHTEQEGTGHKSKIKRE